MPALHKNMSVTEFEAHYYYAAELKTFAAQLGIRVGDLRKFELEEEIKRYLRTGARGLPSARTNQKKTGVRDVLALKTPIQHYVDDKTTKQFLLDEVWKRDPALKLKSGQWYWLNDWRRGQLRRGARPTYQHAVRELTRLMSHTGRLPQIPSARFNNFITDFLADPANRTKRKPDAVAAWAIVKAAPGPKTYAHYKTRRGTSS